MVAGAVADVGRQADGHVPRRGAWRLLAVVPQAGGITHEFVIADNLELVGRLGQHAGTRGVRIAEGDLELRRGGSRGVALAERLPQRPHPALDGLVEVAVA